MNNIGLQEVIMERSGLQTVRQGTVCNVQDGVVLVDLGDGERDVVKCFLLYCSDVPSLTLGRGDTVVLIPPSDREGCWLVLGKVGPYRNPDKRRVSIEAEDELTLKCGESVLQLRHDKVLTRSVDIAQVAKRRNRIKGGSVQIN